MRSKMKTILILLAVLATPLSASDFVVLTATGVIAPEGLTAGQELARGTQLTLEPWGRTVIRETGGCQLTHVIVGARAHPLSPAEDCDKVAGPMEVAAMIQQGMAFAAPIKETGSGEADNLVERLAQEPCVFLPRVSEEGANSRHCPSGYALRGLRCTGGHCDNKDLICCPYLGGEADPTAKEMSTRVISDEFPNSFQSKQFLNGLACTGPFCDNVAPFQFKTQKLVNTRECLWSPFSSELPDQWLDCGPGQLVAGLRCRNDYCGEVSVYCCAARNE